MFKSAQLILFFLPVMVFFSCKKSQNLAPYLTPGQTAPADVIGSWQLEASRVLMAVGNKDTSWQVSGNMAQITFSADSVFSYNSAYAYADEKFDRYMTDTTLISDYILVATVPQSGNFPNYRGFVRLVNKNALIISYMGVDVSPQELYIRK